jgi:hypothetical protein
MTDLLVRADEQPADPTSVPTAAATATAAADPAAERVLPRFDAVAAEPPAESLRREHEAVEALADGGHTEHAAPDTLRAGEAPRPARERVSLSGAMCGFPVH